MKKTILCLLLIAAILTSGCAAKAPGGSGTSGTDAPQTSGALPVSDQSALSDPSVGPAPTSGGSGSSESPAESPATESESELSESTAESGSSETASESPLSDSTPSPEPEPAKYEFNPHLYLPILAEDIPQDYWDSFHNLCDALRAGETVFACSSNAAYKWATDPATLTELFPAACTKIKSKGDDGTVPYENGVGRIYYQMPADEYVERQAQFEAMIVDVLNSVLEPDDSEFEKCLKLYDYMESDYTYDYDFQEVMPDGANYLTFMTHKGECIELAAVYAYFLLQAGVQALGVGGHAPDMSHGWTYLVIDGQGYHADPTWSLKSTVGSDELFLTYFLMSRNRRAESGFDMDDLTAPLLPGYWEKFSLVEFTATDDSLSFPYGSRLVSLDEKERLVRYFDSDGEHELRYGEK